ncbi:MAG TPA: DUF1553 domain-containing protein [Planctomycetes bacterium]|nr:DUF1553 domain-containing protein [Planctomycetaceae bacterium]HIN53578.1 DUF1553 domain-containing protein [Planctomycetota bacterium]
MNCYSLSLRHTMTKHLNLVFFLALWCFSPLVSFAQSPIEIAQKIDELLVSETIVSQTNICDDETFLRRAFFDIVGQPPSLEDVLVYGLEPSVNKRSLLIEFLLTDKTYGANWSRYWRDVIMFRRTNDQSLLGVAALESYLTDALNNGVSWDRIAVDFITAKGDIREDGRAVFIAAQQGRPEETVSEISRIFLGIQIQCAQCHDHPTDRWKQEQFHELVAFFPRVALRPQQEPRSFVVTATDFVGRRRTANANNRFVGTLEHTMPNLVEPTQPGQVMTPKFFVSGQTLPAGTSDAVRRDSLARWITSPDNPWFAKAVTNRVWAELVGEGFYEPVDDIGPDRTPSAPKTMDYLATEFTLSGYDIKWLMQTIMSTQAYQRSSLDRRNYDQIPFQANTIQPLRSDQLFDSMMSVFEISDAGSEGTGQGPRRSQSPRNVFADVFGYDPNDPRGDVTVSIPQSLAMMNSTFINEQIQARQGTMLSRLLQEVQSDRAAVQELYLRVFSRRPNRKELNTSLAYIKQVANRGESFEDLLWALLNSAEFKTRR